MNMASEKDQDKLEVTVTETDEEIVYNLTEDTPDDSYNPPLEDDKEEDKTQKEYLIPLVRSEQKVPMPESVTMYMTPEEARLREEYMKKKIGLVEAMMKKFKELDGEEENIEELDGEE